MGLPRRLKAIAKLSKSIQGAALGAFFAWIALAGPVLCGAQPNLSEAYRIQEHLRLAQDALSANSPEQAVREFEAILAIDKSNATALANLGALAFLREDWSAASAYLQRALESAPTLTKARGLLAICKKRLGDPSAQRSLEAAFPLVEDKKIRAQVGMELADNYYERGDLEHASSTLGALLQIDPDDVDVLYMAQRIYQEMADGTLDKLAVLAPESARMQQVIAERLINAGNLSAALQHYGAALKLNPRLPGVHYEMGESILQSSTTESALAEAEEEFSEAIRVDGESARVEVKLGMLASRRAQPDEAYRHYSRAYALSPNDSDAQLGLATILMLREKPKDALPYLRNVVEADPMNTEARYRLASACRQLGLTEEASRQIALFRESETVKRQVVNVYEQMNRPPISHPDEGADNDK